MKFALPQLFMALPVLLLVQFCAAAGGAQEPGGSGSEAGQMNLRKTVVEREYRGRNVEVEERQFARGDTLWRVLIREKGLAETKFRQYLVVIRELNPQIKNLNIIRVGENVFVPLQPDELLAAQATAKPGAATRLAARPDRGAINEYTVKRGDHLFQILREQLGVTDERELAQYFALVRDLNPEKKNWDALQAGDVIRMPTPPGAVVRAPVTPVVARKAVEPKKLAEPVAGKARAKVIVEPMRVAPEPITLDYAGRIEARENLPVLDRIVQALGGEVARDGQEAVALNEVTVRIDRTEYPVVYDPKVRQKIILDARDQIPGSLRQKLNSPNSETQVLALEKGASLQQAVAQLLSRLGYQALPKERPVVVQQGSIGFEAKGSWMALAPQENQKPQEILVITLTERAGDVPEYLKEELAKKGLRLHDVVLTSEPPSGTPPASSSPKALSMEVKSLPREKREMVDALLLAYGVAFGVSESLIVNLGEGLKVETKVDRIFESRGGRVGIFFQPMDPQVKAALQEQHKMKVVDVDLRALGSKEIIARLFHEMGETVIYRQHRFPAAMDNQERLTVNAWGFLLSRRPMFITDREIPKPLHRFFFDKGLEIVYFQ